MLPYSRRRLQRVGDDGAIPVAIGDDETAAVSSPSEVRDPTLPSRRATLKVLTGALAGRLYVIGGDELVVGRGADIDVQIEDTALSRRHFRIARTASGFVIEDL